MAGENTSGAQLTVIGTEHTLATITAAGVYQCNVDAGVMVDGDALEVRIYGKVQATGGEVLIWTASLNHAQGARALVSLPVISAHHFKATIKQTAGAPRTFAWSVFNA